ncbi:Tetratricopeptide repeat protein 21B [Cichlidogyrus casuarinus]|uniref:Tetratricopeptide repeat protein 21B n=1 Tax=Cichlidogyrus casuarinus TaxID=1844966 RepID=A0ABD2PQQ7_9PLAT
MLTYLHVLNESQEKDTALISSLKQSIKEKRKTSTSHQALFYASLVNVIFGRIEKSHEYVERSYKMGKSDLSLLLKAFIEVQSPDSKHHSNCEKTFKILEGLATTTNSLILTVVYSTFLRQQKLNDKAEEVLIRYISSNPSHPGYALIEVMTLCMAENRWDDMMMSAKQCVSTNPYLVEPLLAQCIYYLTQTSEWEKTGKILDDLYQMVLKHEPQSAMKLSTVFATCITLMEPHSPLLKHLLRFVERELVINPRGIRYMIDYAKYLLYSDKPSEAIQYLEKVITLQKDSLEAAEIMSRCLVQMNSLKDAEIQIEVLKSSSISPVSYFMQAQVARLNGCSAEKVIELLDEAAESHLVKLEKAVVDLNFYRMLNLNFVLELVDEYLHHLPDDKDAIMGDNAILVTCTKLLRTLVQFSSGNTRVSLHIAKVCFLKDEVKEAVKTLKKLIEDHPECTEGYLLLAKVVKFTL